MRYWLTTHWPPREDAPKDEKPYVWLRDEEQAAGASLAPGDLVLVYQSRSGKTIVRERRDGSTENVRCLPGKGGIIYYGEVIGNLATVPGKQPDRYTDGRTSWWRWCAPLKILSRSGFVGCKDVATALGYAPTYSFRGFGQQHSGLGEISASEFQNLVAAFHAHRPIALPSFSILHGGGPSGEGGESSTHLFLKEYVAADPATALGEPGLKTQKTEYSLPTGDRADVVLSDAHGRIVGVEIEPAVGASEIVGALQAIKYRYMLECVARRAPGDSRAFLVAHSIDPDMKKLCKSYAVDYFEIDKARVDQWRRFKA